MILMMSNSKANHAAALAIEPYAHESIRVIDDLKLGLKEARDQLIILDIDTDDKLVSCLDPGTFAETLLKNGLPSHLNSVVFITPDINAHTNLCTFSRAFIAQLEKSFHHPVTAYVPTNLNYASTFIVPPSAKSHHWELIGIQNRPSERQLNLGIFTAIKKKTVLWEGPDIVDGVKANGRAIHTLPDDIGKIMFAL